MTAGKGFAPKTSKPKGEASPTSLWARSKRRAGVDWREVDGRLIQCALSTVVAGGGALMISGAAGGLGVCLTLFAGREKPKEFALTADEVTELLDSMIDYMQSPSEDVRQAFGIADEDRAAAD